MTTRRQGRDGLLMTLFLGAVVASGCVADSDDTGEEITSEAKQRSVVLLGNIFQNGTLVSFENITNITGIDMTKIVGLTACDPKALYAVEQNAGPTYALWFSNDSGQSWKKQSTAGKSKEIACDHAQLATLDASKNLWVAPLQANGVIGAWSQAPTSVKVDRIQGGDGSIYGVKVVASGKDVYVASAKSINGPLDWGSPIANIGATQVTGTGLTRSGTDDWAIGNTLAWSRRAFALETNGTISTNPTLLDGQNLWTGMNTGSERYLTLTAAAPNILFGIQDRNGVKQINRIRIDETSCSDGVDNDRNGHTDGEDPACVQTVANTFCSTHSAGDYCADRFQPSFFLDQSNQNASLVHCSGGVATSITPGVCTRNSNTSITNADSLPSLNSLTPADPPNTGRYCNVHWPDGSWGFNWTGSTPCTTLLNQKPNGKVVRAGLYSTNAANHVFAACSDGWVGPSGSAGVAPLQAVYNAVGKTTNACIFQVSAGALPLFDRMFVHELPLPRLANPFVHNRTAVPLAQFGNGDTGTGFVDRFGAKMGGPREPAYDNPLDEGRPLYAPANGVVITNGSRVRDVSQFGCGGTPNQGEIYVKYSVGSSATYRESFVVYYAHVRKRLVVDGQTVKSGQILGYVGAGGCTGGFGHLHTGVFRLSNTNAHTAAAPELGYHMNFQANNDDTGTNTGGHNSIDPLGWANFSAFDPWAYTEWNTATSYGFTGIGAWSVNLFKAGKAFRYP